MQGTHRKHCYSVAVSNYCRGNALVCEAVTAVVYLLISRSFPSNGSTCHIAPSLLSFVPNSLQVYRHVFLPDGLGKTFESCQCSYISGSYAASSLFFRLGRSRLLHNVLTLIFRLLKEDPTFRFTVSSKRACLKASLTFPLHPSHICCFRLRSLMPLFLLGFARRPFTNVRFLGLLVHRDSLILDDRVPCAVKE
jgi:hypothetical protein